MNQKLVKIIGIIALITFILGIVGSLFGIGLGVLLDNAADNLSGQTTQAVGKLIDWLGVFGGKLFGGLSIVFGIITALFNTIAHIPALIAYKIGKKGCSVTVYWLLVSLWVCLAFGVSILIIVF